MNAVIIESISTGGDVIIETSKPEVITRQPTKNSSQIDPPDTDDCHPQSVKTGCDKATLKRLYQGEWNEDICEWFICMSPKTCLMVHFCPCIVAGRNAKSAKCLKLACSGALLFGIPIVGHLMMTMTRTKTREIYKIPGTRLEDCLIVTCCLTCNLNQVRNQYDLVPTSVEQVIIRK